MAGGRAVVTSHGFGEVAVEGAPADTDGRRDLGDGVPAVEHLTGDAQLCRSHYAGPAPDPPASPRGCQALEGGLRDQVGEHLVLGRQDVEQEPAGRGRGVDPLVQHHQIDPALVQLPGQLGEVAHRAGQPREPGHHDLVAGAQLLVEAIPIGAACELARGLVQEHPLTPGDAQSVELAVGVLLSGADPGVSSAVSPCLTELLICSVARR